MLSLTTKLKEYFATRRRHKADVQYARGFNWAKAELESGSATPEELLAKSGRHLQLRRASTDAFDLGVESAVKAASSVK